MPFTSNGFVPSTILRKAHIHLGNRTGCTNSLDASGRMVRMTVRASDADVRSMRIARPATLPPTGASPVCSGREAGLATLWGRCADVRTGWTDEARARRPERSGLRESENPRVPTWGMGGAAAVRPVATAARRTHT